MRFRRTLFASSVLAGVLTCAGLTPAAWAQAHQGDTHTRISHVLLISVDGLHAVDLANYVTTHPQSTLAQLSGAGVTYPNAATSQPSDSFPGLLTAVTGGSPRSDGVYYDDSYDRSLVAPVVLGGSPTGVTCTPGAPHNPRGTEVLYDETVDVNLDRIDGGGGINPQALPRDPVTCQPVYPHSFLRVNTIFERSPHDRHLRADEHHRAARPRYGRVGDETSRTR